MKETLESLRQRYVDDVVAVIREVVRREADSESTLVEMCEYHLDTGGKRLRATIPLAVAESLDGSAETLVPFAAGCELLHNATLVHDDLQDGDVLRRNHPTVWKKYGREQAVNAGDAMLYWALACLDRLDVSDSAYRRCVRRFVRRTTSIIEGQQLEFELMERRSPSKDAYRKMVEGKTGSLFVLTMAGAAELAGAEPKLVERLGDAARHLGVLFQIQDDVLDLYGEKGRGERGADLREGKISALVVYHLRRSSDVQAERLREILDADRDDVRREEIEQIADQYRRSGALAAALDEIERRRDRALQTVAAEDRTPLGELVAGLAELFVTPIGHLL